MRNLPRTIIQVLRQFELLFSERVWEWAKSLLVGAILAPGKRSVTAVLRVMGLSDDAQFQNYHRVLNRAVWSLRTVSRVLLRLLVLTSGTARWYHSGKPLVATIWRIFEVQRESILAQIAHVRAQASAATPEPPASDG